MPVKIKKEGFLKRWFRRLIRETLEEHDRGKFLTIYSSRDPDERDILYHPGAQWLNQTTGKRFALKQVTGEWKEMLDEK